MKQGSAAVGLRSKTHAIILGLKVRSEATQNHVSNLKYDQRSTGELASYQQKMYRIDDHVGIAIAGLTSDARVLRYAEDMHYPKMPYTDPVGSNFMRQQAMASKMVFNRPVPVNRLVSAIADSM